MKSHFLLPLLCAIAVTATAATLDILQAPTDSAPSPTDLLTIYTVSGSTSTAHKIALGQLSLAVTPAWANLTGKPDVTAGDWSIDASGNILIGSGPRTIFGGAVVLTRALSGSDNPHGFDENSTVTPTVDGLGVNAFDARTQLGGTHDINHYVAFQHDSVHSSSGTTTNLISLSSHPSVSAGVITSRMGVSIDDPTITGGAITNNYGIYVNGLAAGTDNYAIYTVGNTPSFFGGVVTIGTNADFNGLSVAGRILGYAGDPASLVSIGQNFADGQGGIYVIGGAAYSEIQSLQEGVAITPLVLQRRGGAIFVGATSDDGTGALVQMPSISSAGPATLHNASSPATPTGGALLYATSGEMHVIDASGNDTIISPHAKDAPAALYETGPGIDEMEGKANVFLGIIQWSAVSRRKRLDYLDMMGRLGTPEESSTAWTEILQRQANHQILCYTSETYADYATRTGQSRWPTAKAATWPALTPSQRWADAEADHVAAAQTTHDAWTARKAAALAASKPFTEPEPALYTAQPAPAWCVP